jgi:ribokinase
MSRRILVAGAINTDLVANVDRAPEAGETITGQSFAIHSGGKGANQAVAVARSGADAVMLGGVGHDDFGRGRLADLDRDNVDTSWVARIDEVSSGVALIVVESSGENRISYIPAATLEVPPVYCERAVQSIRPAMILTANELSPDCLNALFTWARDQQTRVVFNAAPYSKEAIDLLPLVDVLIVNRGEAAALQGTSVEGCTPADLAAGLRKIGARDVIITLGDEGAFALHDDQTFAEPVLNVDVVDTTGAGDTFCGAFAATLLDGATFRDAVRYANTAGAIATTRPGAQSSIPTRDDIEEALERWIESGNTDLERRT